jgi:hypothetical protein
MDSQFRVIAAVRGSRREAERKVLKLCGAGRMLEDYNVR